jgi:hypothetical protein
MVWSCKARTETLKKLRRNRAKSRVSRQGIHPNSPGNRAISGLKNGRYLERLREWWWTQSAANSSPLNSLLNRENTGNSTGSGPLAQAPYSRNPSNSAPSGAGPLPFGLLLSGNFPRAIREADRRNRDYGRWFDSISVPVYQMALIRARIVLSLGRASRSVAFGCSTPNSSLTIIFLLCIWRSEPALPPPDSRKSPVRSYFIPTDRNPDRN